MTDAPSDQVTYLSSLISTPMENLSDEQAL